MKYKLESLFQYVPAVSPCQFLQWYIASGMKSDVKGAHPRTIIVPPGTENILVEFNVFLASWLIAAYGMLTFCSRRKFFEGQHYCIQNFESDWI